MRFLNETRVALLLSMHKVCMTLVNVEINFKNCCQISYFYLKQVTSIFEISNGYLVSKQGLTLLGISF